ncbi:MAG TPA: hypothetical protein ENK08_10215 [Chloroflexi bacterium]|nr:hypothetical protein [Chloroflexota bacterium]
MPECIVCKGEYEPGRPCPRCGADNTPWERWREQMPEEQGGWRSPLAFAEPHLYLPFVITFLAFGCGLLGLGGVWAGLTAGVQLLFLIMTVSGCLLAFYAVYEARHQIREQQLLSRVRSGRLAWLRRPNARAILLPALTLLLLFLFVLAILSSDLLRSLLCIFVFEPGYCKNPPGGLRARLLEAFPLILALFYGGGLISFTYSSSLLLALRYANRLNEALPQPIFLDENRLACIVRRAAEQVLNRRDGMTVQVVRGMTTMATESGATGPVLPPSTDNPVRQGYVRMGEQVLLSGRWNWEGVERTADGGIRMRAYAEVRKGIKELIDGSRAEQSVTVVYTVTADPWGRIRKIERQEKDLSQDGFG